MSSNDQNEQQPCPICKAYHGVPPLEHLKPGEPCGFDPERSCVNCGDPVGALSVGGPDICPNCDSGYQKPKKSPFEGIKTGLEELLDVMRSGEPLEDHFRTSEVRMIETPDGEKIISRVVTEPGQNE